MCNGEIHFFDAKVKTFDDIKKLVSNFDVLLRHVKNCNCVVVNISKQREFQ